MQLVAYGAQDIYLTGNPQITFFKVVYRRHTNFAMEAIQQTLNGTPADGATVTATISRNGDLVGKLYVNSSTLAIINGDDIISEVELEIGGQKIDKHYKEWNQIWAELTTPDSKALAFKNMTGALSHGLNKTGTAGVKMVQIPLNFWFCRNPGLALPLIALQYHEVKVKMVLGTAVGTAGVKLWADYIYLDTDERRRFAQVSHEYLIEQLQKETQSSTTATETKLNFNHPVKEIIWTSAATNVYADAKLILNGHDRFAAQEEEYFQLRQPIDCHTAVPGANIPMADRPVMLSLPVDSGATTHATTAVGNTALLIAVGGASFSNDVSPTGVETTAFNDLWKVGDIILYDVAGDAADPASASQHQITALTAAVSTTSAGVVTVSPVMVVPANTDKISITIIARLQDPLSRCSQLTDKINCYSFALKPEEHQPSGTCNFSRIDNARLKFSTTNGVAFNIYAVNYNVLRIMSGMGGLAYSN